MKHSTLILVIRRLSERARYAQAVKCYYLGARDYRQVAVHERIVAKCRAKIDQLTERYS